jgi:hypothetical protein
VLERLAKLSIGQLAVLLLLAVVGTAGAYALVSQWNPGSDQARTSERGPEAERVERPTHLIAAREAVREFLPEYLRVIYGKPGADPRRIERIGPDFRNELLYNPARVPGTYPETNPRLGTISVSEHGPDRAQANVPIDNGSGFFALTLELARTPDGWLVVGTGS